MVSPAEYVRAVTARLDEVDDDFAMLPTLLVMACVDVLPIDGAGLSVISDIRIPLGSSGPSAVLAEMLQVSLGSGPCLSAAGRVEPVCCDEWAMATEWPVYHRELRRQTTYRSVLSMPLALGGYVGALDLYSTDPTAVQLPAPEEVWDSVGNSICELMLDVPTIEDRSGLELPAWLVGDRIETRMQVWVAVGMVMEHTEATSSDALALLRARAFTRDWSLEQIATEIIGRRLTVADVVETV